MGGYNWEIFQKLLNTNYGWFKTTKFPEKLSHYNSCDGSEIAWKFHIGKRLHLIVKQNEKQTSTEKISLRIVLVAKPDLVCYIILISLWFTG